MGLQKAAGAELDDGGLHGGSYGIGLACGGRGDWHQDDVPGYRSFKLPKTELDGLASDHPHIHRRAETLPKGQLASAFAAIIGIKSRGWHPRLSRSVMPMLVERTIP